MVRSFLFVSCVLGLIAAVQGQPSGKVEQVFVGERDNCRGLSAKIDVQNAFAEVNGEEIVRVVAEAFANALEDVEVAKAEATSIGVKVLTVTAEAVANIKADINTPNQGCWAVTYGKAEARALATAVVEAVAEGVGFALSPDATALAFATASTKAESIEEAVASVALLLARGDGTGSHSQSASATATAKATAVNCAIAHAFAEAYKDNQASAEVIVQAGCPFSVQPFASNVAKANLETPCACLSVERSGAPAGCGALGGADQICYVQDPSRCSCGQKSVVHRGQVWRFCGKTLSIMKSQMDFDDESNDITRVEGNFGYCPTLKA
eukprot:TRINITY_DN471_c4_g2_i1.p1 TRINITY_DN471_c4_g2~~TRINITY_DN471_c4_g2_i1.p1  ORF type:complete len:324 (-),score=75.28 TRINITY_DN471_c4_g2_i1:581-1552(-)